MNIVGEPAPNGATQSKETPKLRDTLTGADFKIPTLITMRVDPSLQVDPIQVANINFNSRIIHAQKILSQYALQNADNEINFNRFATEVEPVEDVYFRIRDEVDTLGRKNVTDAQRQDIVKKIEALSVQADEKFRTFAQKHKIHLGEHVEVVISTQAQLEDYVQANGIIYHDGGVILAKVWGPYHILKTVQDLPESKLYTDYLHKFKSKWKTVPEEIDSVGILEHDLLLPEEATPASTGMLLTLLNNVFVKPVLSDLRTDPRTYYSEDEFQPGKFDQNHIDMPEGYTIGLTSGQLVSLFRNLRQNIARERMNEKPLVKHVWLEMIATEDKVNPKLIIKLRDDGRGYPQQLIDGGFQENISIRSAAPEILDDAKAKGTAMYTLRKWIEGIDGTIIPQARTDGIDGEVPQGAETVITLPMTPAAS